MFAWTIEAGSIIANQSRKLYKGGNASPYLNARATIIKALERLGEVVIDYPYDDYRAACL